MLPDAVPYLACPLCGEDFALAAGALRCPAGHSFDVARQGYANLLAGSARPGTADSEEMVAARAAFFAAGHYDVIAAAVADAAQRVLLDAPAGCVADIGAGTGFYLAEVLGRAPDRVGVALDISKRAARRAARAHPHIAAVVGDVWVRLPLRTGSAALVLDVFAPRNAAEFRRVLADDGALLVVTPGPQHLRELVEDLGLISVQADKDERLAEKLGADFALLESAPVSATMRLTHADVLSLAAMGPSARHIAPADLAARVAALPDPVEVTASVTVSVWRPRPEARPV